MRPLSPDEQALWARVTATIRPLSRDRDDRHSAEEKPAIPSARQVTSRANENPRPPQLSPAAPPPKPGTTLDGSWDKRLRGGAVQPDRIIDLHGHNLDQAWTAIDRGLESAIARGDRVILLITGHARPGEPPVQRGRIRAAVHDWLAVSRHAGRIAAVRGAHRRHGGGGSLYIVLRRN